ncbi:MAG: twin-arginine translocation signal domain-containing protein [Dysgonamonadaceae bacterium]|nr:twin-arginine translocation signal domain-containing protein [Dysgonamonadaceae bacterium]
MKTNRRKFIKQAAAIAGGVVFKDSNSLINSKPCNW